MHLEIFSAVVLAGALSGCCVDIGGFNAAADGGNSANGGKVDAGSNTPTLKTNLMFLIDKSGSMTDPIYPGGPTKMNELKSALSTFLGAHGDDARMALTLYPSDNICGAAVSIARDFPPAHDADDAAATNDNLGNATQILAQVQTVSPSGGSPTGNSLAFVGNTPGLNAADARADVVVLITDGLPNCNATNAASCVNAAACKCTLSSCGSAGSQFCTLGCLDQQGSVNQVLALKQKGISTVVVGIGGDILTGDGPATFNALAEAGGYPRTCPNGTNPECGVNNTCDAATRLCTNRFYQASSASDLVSALGNIVSRTAPSH